MLAMLVALNIQSSAFAAAAPMSIPPAAPEESVLGPQLGTSSADAK